MNVDVVGRICPSRPGEQELRVHIPWSGKAVSVAPGGEGISFSFQELFDGRATTQTVFFKALQPLLSMFAEGMNVYFMTFGESDSKKWHLLMGDRSDRSGLIPLIIDYLSGELLLKRD